MKNARINNLSFGIALALVGAQIPMNAAAGITLPEPPLVDIVGDAYYSATSGSGPEISRIEYGGSATGMIGDGNDYVESDGVRHKDYFAFEVSDPTGGYEVTLRSDSFAGFSTLWFVDQSTNNWIQEQGALVWAPGKQVQYSGSFPQAGVWVIEVTSIDENQGGYSVSVNSNDSGVSGPSNCEAPSTENPYVEVSPGSVLNCSLSGNEQIVLNTDRGKHYAKGFHFTGNGDAVTIWGESSDFTPWFVLVDPATGQVLDVKEKALSGQFTGDVYYLVTSAEPGATGAFSTGVEVGSPSNGGYLKPAGLTPSFGLPSHYEIVE